MAKFKGRGFLLQIQTDDSPLTYATIGGFETNDLTKTNESVDVTDKGTAPHRELLQGAGIQSKSVTGNGFVSDDAQFELVVAAAEADTFVILKLISDAGDTHIGTFQVTNFQRGGEKNGAETFSCTFESSGQIVYTPPA